MIKKISKQFLICFLFVVMALILICYVNINNKSEKIVNNYDNSVSYNNGWFYFDGKNKVQISEFPNFIKSNNKEITIYKIIDNDIKSENFLCLELKSHSMSVYLNDKIIYTADQKIEGYFNPGIMQMHFVDLSGAKQNDIIKVKILVPEVSHNVKIMRADLGTKSDILFSLIKSSIPAIIIALIAALFLLYFLALTLFMIINKIRHQIDSFCWLSIFIIFSTIWIITDSDISQLIFKSYSDKYLLSNLSFMLLPVPFLMFFKTRFNLKNKNFDILGIVNLVLVAASLILFMLNILYFESGIFVYHILTVFSITYTVYIFMKIKKEEQVEFVFGLAALYATVIVSIVRFYLYNYEMRSLVYKYGFIVFVVCMFIISLKSMIMFQMSEVKAKDYKKMAYRDSVSRLFNRLAFEEGCKELQKNITQYKSIGFVIFDFNNFKNINDEYGHLAGDELIYNFSLCLLSIFMRDKRFKCYRVGGDEFAIAFENVSEVMLKEYLEKLKVAVEDQNEYNGIKILYAQGYAIENAHKDLNIKEVFNKADANMYQHKFKIKGIK